MILRKGCPVALPNFIRVHSGDVFLAVKLQPRASRNEIGAEAGGELRIKVTAPAVDFAANEALIRFLAMILDCPKSRVELVRGEKSRHKVVRLHGFTGEQAMARLQAAE